MTERPPEQLIDWRGNDWSPDAGHPRRPSQRPLHGGDRAMPVAGARVGHPAGVPIDAMVFGGRRAHLVPLVHEAPTGRTAMFLGTIMSREDGRRRRQRSASCASTRSRCCRSAATTWPTISQHWLRIGERDGAKLPRMFCVNWFRKDEDGKFLWPGFGENIRVLAWIFRRCEGKAQAVETAIGLVPPVGAGGIDIDGLDITAETMQELLEVDIEGWRESLPQMQEHYSTFGDKLPAELRAGLNALEARLQT